MKLLGKPINFYATAGVNENENVFELIMQCSKAIEKQAVDMYVIERNKDEFIQIRSAGYDLKTQQTLDEKTVIRIPSDKNLITKTVWLKIDDYGDKFVATFLYPSEY